MNKDQAQEVKDILMQITDHIPNHLTDRIHIYYTMYIKPGHPKPCKCTPRYWQDMLNELRDKVELVINEPNAETTSTTTT